MYNQRGELEPDDPWFTPNQRVDDSSRGELSFVLFVFPGWPYWALVALVIGCQDHVLVPAASRELVQLQL